MDTVLIVDDDAAMCLLIERMLRDDSYTVLTARDGVEAQSMLRSSMEKISSILLDWQMPKMNGIEFLQWIKKDPDYEQIPVIMETSMTMPENIKEGIDAGAFYYLTKPIDEKVLRSIVRAAIVDYHQEASLLERIRRSDNPFAQLVEATFRYRTTEEAEFLAVAIANSSAVPERAMMISEILTNAVEHGNLGITYQEKTLLVTNNSLNKEVKRRLAMSEFADKYVNLRILRSENGIRVEIEDEGNGFEFQRYLQMDESRVFDNHGRGIALTNEYLKLEYLGRGNKVVVTIPGK
jgi:CheY-like chemotaxis protein/anti-sigma regulatory factor (Ser/Thr protein kinase)